MEIIFYVSAGIAIASTIMVITHLQAIQALLYMILSLLSVAAIFFVLGAPFVAALEIIIYAGAIMVLFVFVIMMLNLGPQATEQERRWFNPRVLRLPAILALLLLAELVYILLRGFGTVPGTSMLEPKQVSSALFGSYLLAVELASILLLAGLVGAYHLGRRKKSEQQRKGRGI